MGRPYPPSWQVLGCMRSKATEVEPLHHLVAACLAYLVKPQVGIARARSRMVFPEVLCRFTPYRPCKVSKHCVDKSQSLHQTNSRPASGSPASWHQPPPENTKCKGQELKCSEFLGLGVSLAWVARVLLHGARTVRATPSAHSHFGNLPPLAGHRWKIGLRGGDSGWEVRNSLTFANRAHST